MQLRQYQDKIISEVRSKIRAGVKRQIVCAPTGSGKTILAAFMLGESAKKGLRSFFTVHRRELVSQSLLAFQDAGIPCGVIASGFPADPEQPIQICSIQTLARRLDKTKMPSLIVWDEGHHLAASQWSRVYDKCRDIFHIGLTATPHRLDGKGLSDYFDHIVYGPSVKDLIKQGSLTDYKLYAPSTISLDGVRKIAGDYNKGDLAEIVGKCTGSAINEYKKFANGKRAIVFCCSIEHSEAVVKEFNKASIPAAHVDGDTPTYEREMVIRLFKEDKLKIVSNVDLFGEGLDIPALEAVILLRPTMSLGLHLQQVGRSLRPHPGKTHAIILDHVGNTVRHGLPDEDREWSLSGKKKGNKEKAEPGAKICGKCFGASPPMSKVCAVCGTAFEVQSREVDLIEGELEEMDKKEIAKLRQAENKRAKTLDELIALGKARGYKSPSRWANYVLNGRKKKWENYNLQY